METYRNHRLSRREINKSPKKMNPQEFVTRKIVGHDDLNGNGSLFGGKIMAWIDEVAFMSARRHAGRAHVVTVQAEISFVKPAYQGEHVVLTSQVCLTGRTTMEIHVKVEREDPFDGSRSLITNGLLTFVALNAQKKVVGVPAHIAETDEQKQLERETALRVKVRSRLRNFLKRQARPKDAEIEPRYLLTRKLKEIGAKEWSKVIDRKTLFVEKTWTNVFKNLG